MIPLLEWRERRERCMPPTLWLGRRRSFGVCGRRRSCCKGGKPRDGEAHISSQLRSQAHLVRLFLCWSLCSSGGNEALLVDRSIVDASNGSTVYNASCSGYSSSFSSKSNLTEPSWIEPLLLWIRRTCSIFLVTSPLMFLKLSDVSKQHQSRRRRCC